MLNENFLAEGVRYSFSTPSNIPLTRGCYVAFLDLMGFKDKVARSDHAEILSDLRNLSEHISQYLNGNNRINFAMFSDSLLFVTEGGENEDISSLAGLLSRVMAYSLAHIMPLKGAIAKGKFTADMSKQLFFGQPLIDAYLLEESMQIYGVAAHHSIEKEARELGAQSLFLDKDIPLKKGHAKHYLLNWFVDKEKSKESLTAIRASVSDSPRRYIDNTLSLIE